MLNRKGTEVAACLVLSPPGKAGWITETQAWHTVDDMEACGYKPVERTSGIVF